jgi:hypothetical protein
LPPFPEPSSAGDFTTATLNRFQRSPNWRELNFCRIVWGRIVRHSLTKLPIRDGEVKPLSVARHPGDEPELLHVSFWAVGGVGVGALWLLRRGMCRGDCCCPFAN